MLRVSRSLIATVLALLLGPSGAGAGRPLQTEDTGTVAAGDVEVAVAADFSTLTDQRIGLGLVTVTVGLSRALEGRIEASGFTTDHDGEPATSGFATAAIGIKYRLLEETGHRQAALAALTVLGRPKATERDLEGAEPAHDGVALDARLAVSKTVGATTLTGNGGYEFSTGGTTVHALLLGLSVDHRVTKALSLVAETFSTITFDHEAPIVIVRAGAVYAITDRIRLDGAVGAGLTRTSPDVTATIGVTLRF